VGDLNTVLTVEINGEKFIEDVEIQEDGSFRSKVDLIKGKNNIEVIAESANGFSEKVGLEVELKDNSLLLLIILGVGLLIIVLTASVIIIRKRKKNKSENIRKDNITNEMHDSKSKH
jgi:cytochrome c-type biogenesis protein CcmH/NrfF